MQFCVGFIFPSTPSHETIKGERSDCVGPGRLGGISSCFRAHGEEGLSPDDASLEGGVQELSLAGNRRHLSLLEKRCSELYCLL